MTPNRLTPDAFREAPKTQVRVVLENIRSGLNVGAFFRTGDSLRIDGIDLCGYTAHPLQRDILKSALGATEHVAWTAHENALDAIAALREQEFAIAAIEQTANSTSLLDWHPEPGSKWAFVFGNEVRGLKPTRWPPAIWPWKSPVRRQTELERERLRRHRVVGRRPKDWLTRLIIGETAGHRHAQPPFHIDLYLILLLVRHVADARGAVALIFQK